MLNKCWFYDFSIAQQGFFSIFSLICNYTTNVFQHFPPILDLLNSAMSYPICQDKFQDSIVIPKFSLLCRGCSLSFTVSVFATVPESRPSSLSSELLTCGNKMLSNKVCWHEDTESQKKCHRMGHVQPQ